MVKGGCFSSREERNNCYNKELLMTGVSVSEEKKVLNGGVSAWGRSQSCRTVVFQHREKIKKC
jgi:hypothetical protein